MKKSMFLSSILDTFIPEEIQKRFARVSIQARRIFTSRTSEWLVPEVRTRQRARPAVDPRRIHPLQI